MKPITLQEINESWPGGFCRGEWIYESSDQPYWGGIFNAICVRYSSEPYKSTTAKIMNYASIRAMGVKYEFSARSQGIAVGAVIDLFNRVMRDIDDDLQNLP
jgi:hypothetical protein